RLVEGRSALELRIFCQYSVIPAHFWGTAAARGTGLFRNTVRRSSSESISIGGRDGIGVLAFGATFSFMGGVFFLKIDDKSGGLSVSLSPAGSSAQTIFLNRSIASPEGATTGAGGPGVSSFS